MGVIVTKKGNYNTECTDWSSAHEVVLHLCLSLVGSHMKYQTSSGALGFRNGRGHLEKAQKMLVSVAGGTDTISIKKDLEQRTEESGEA